MGANITTQHVNASMNQIASSEVKLDVDKLKAKVNVNDMTAYITADAFQANPDQLIGQVVVVRKVKGACPESYNSPSGIIEFYPFPVTGIKLDDKTQQSPPQLRGEILVDSKMSVQVGFLSYLNGQLSDNESFNLVVFDQKQGLVNFQDPSWGTALKNWIQSNPGAMSDPDICYIYVVSGYVQKNIARKKFQEFNAGTQAGAYGVNIEGKLSTNVSAYTLDVIFGLTPAILRRPAGAAPVAAFAGGTRPPFMPTDEELLMFSSVSGSRVK